MLWYSLIGKHVGQEHVQKGIMGRHVGASVFRVSSNPEVSEAAVWHVCETVEKSFPPAKKRGSAELSTNFMLMNGGFIKIEKILP